MPWNPEKSDNFLCYEQLSGRLYPATLSAIQRMVASQRALER